MARLSSKSYRSVEWSRREGLNLASLAHRFGRALPRKRFLRRQRRVSAYRLPASRAHSDDRDRTHHRAWVVYKRSNRNHPRSGNGRKSSTPAPAQQVRVRPALREVAEARLQRRALLRRELSGGFVFVVSCAT